MTFNPDLKYSKSHEWVRMDGDVAVIGISDFAPRTPWAIWCS